jgi:uncharacterized protein YndB with AHSA1/START domain
MTSVTLVRRIAARPSIVFDYLTTPDGVAAWFGPDESPVTTAELDPRVGGNFRVRFKTVDGKEHEASGEYLEVDPPRRISMSWQWTEEGEPEELGRTSRVDFVLRPIEEGVELTLTHAKLKNEISQASHDGGWAGALNKLVRILGEASAANDR